MRKELKIKKGQNIIETIINNKDKFMDSAIFTSDDSIFDGLKVLHKRKLGTTMVAIYSSVVNDVEYSLSVLSHVNMQASSKKEVYEHKICDCLLRDGTPVYAYNSLKTVKKNFVLVQDENQAEEQK